MPKPIFKTSALTIVLVFGTVAHCCMPFMAAPMADFAEMGEAGMPMADCCSLEAAPLRSEEAVLTVKTAPIQFDSLESLAMSAAEVSTNDVVPKYQSPSAIPVPLETGVLRI